MSCRHNQHKEKVHEQCKLGDVLTSHHLHHMQTRGHTYETVLAYTGQRLKDFLNPDFPKTKVESHPQIGHPLQLQ